MIATHEPGLEGPLVAGVDVGGTKTAVVVVDARDRILYEHLTPTNQSSLVRQIAGLVDEARKELRRDIDAVGVAIPGHVDPEDGSVSMAVNLGITHMRLGPMLQTELGVPVFVEHDARAAAQWLSVQLADGSVQAPASVAFLAIGTGISAGVVLDGVLLRGDNGFAGEVGHSSPTRMESSAHAGCAAVSRRSSPVPRSGARPMRRSPPVTPPSCLPIRVPQMCSAPVLPATRSPTGSPTAWQTTWPERSDRSPSPLASSESSSAAASRPREPVFSNPSDRASPVNARPRH